MIYRRGKIWWFRFKFAGQTIRESSKSNSKTIARDAERMRRRELERGYNGIDKQQRAQLLGVAADNWLEAKKSHLSPRSVIIEQLNFKHLKPFFGGMLICDIRGDDIASYQSARLRAGASPTYVPFSESTDSGPTFNRTSRCSGRGTM